MIDLDAVTQAITDHLNDNGVLAGRGKKPSGGGWSGSPGQSAYVPYAIVWRIGAKDITHRDADAVFDEGRPLFHIRTVGGTASEADQHLTDATDALLQTPVTFVGASTVHLIYDTSITTTRDTDVEPNEFYTGAYMRWWIQEDA